MITLVTGLPGNCKTLYTLCFLKAYAEKNPGRGVYYSGIKGLTLPWTNIGGFIKDEETGQTTEIIPADAPVRGGAEWYKLPVGSIVLIDECQNYFRVRGQGQPVPESVKEFETHRHRGFDIFLITQHPMLIDTNVRRMVERHYHCMRWFGLQRSTIHEFQGVKEQVDKSRNGSVKHEFKFPKAAYAWYKSAEVHTVKSRIPARFWFLFAVPVLMIGLGYLVYSRMYKYAASDGAKERIQGKGALIGDRGSPGEGGSRAARPMTDLEYAQAFRPRVTGLPHSAPIFDDVMKPVVAPTPSGCVQSSTKCSCFTDQATQLDVSEDVCKHIVSKGFFRYWALPDRNVAARPEPMQVPKPQVAAAP